MTAEAVAPFWESRFDNHANDLRPELCPIGKFGYDPRCRDFYDTGKRLAEAGEAQLYVAPPRALTDSTIGQTLTSPLLDPVDNKYVGQAYVDVLSDSIVNIFSAENTWLSKSGFPLLLTAYADRSGGDTIIGPGFKVNEKNVSKPVEKVLFGDDSSCRDEGCQQMKEEFRELIDRIKSSQEVQNETFSVRAQDGSDKRMFIVYTPVVVETYEPLNSSDFKRGMAKASNVIYYLALTESEDDLQSSFDEVQEDMEVIIDIGIGIMSITIVLATAMVIYISYLVAVSISHPMLYFLELICIINE